MNCFLFIFMITLTVATTTPVYDLSYKETVDLVDNFNSLKKENEKCKEIIIEQNKTIQANSEKIASNVQSTEDKNSDPGANYQAIKEKFSALEAKYQAITNQVSVLNQITEQKISALKTKDQETEGKISAIEAKYQVTERKISAIEAKDQVTERKISAIEAKDQVTEGNISAIEAKDKVTEGKFSAIEAKDKVTERKISAIEAKYQVTEGKISALEAKDQETEGKISAIEAKDQVTEGKISALEAKDQETEGKISAIEAKDQVTEGKISALETKQEKIISGLPGDCEEIYASGKTNDGVYTIYPDYSPMQVYCEMSQTQGSIVIQKRYDGSLDYARMFQEYSDGFGDLKAEHWLGLSLMNRITATGRWKLRIELVSFENEARYAEYSDFKIGPAPGFRLLFDKSSYKGDAGGDGLHSHHSMLFSSRDKDQDLSSGNCSVVHGGNAGWWFRNCGTTMTTGMPYRAHRSIIWSGWRGELKSVTLKIKKF